MMMFLSNTNQMLFGDRACIVRRKDRSVPKIPERLDIRSIPKQQSCDVCRSMCGVNVVLCRLFPKFSDYVAIPCVDNLLAEE